MKLRIPCIFKCASMGFFGLAFAHSVSAAVIIHAVDEPSMGTALVDPDFGDDYSYTDPGAWITVAPDNRYNNTAYVAGSAKRPTPYDGDVSLHGGGDYTYQLLVDNFVAGRTYTFSVHSSSDVDDPTNVSKNMRKLYFYDSVTYPGGFLAEGSELAGARYLPDGTVDEFIGASSVNEGWSLGAGTGNWVADGGTWGLTSLSYTATAADAGKQIGIAFQLGSDAVVDAVTVTSIPERSVPLLGLGGTLLMLRRRRSRQA